jgi:hypothetical protein
MLPSHCSDDNAIAEAIQGDTGTLTAMYLFNELTQDNIEQIASRMIDQLASIKDEITFSAPLEEVQIIGGMVVPIEELRALEAQYGSPPSPPSSDLLLE